jgi:hypothetical protein
MHVQLFPCASRLMEWKKEAEHMHRFSVSHKVLVPPPPTRDFNDRPRAADQEISTVAMHFRLYYFTSKVLSSCHYIRRESPMDSIISPVLTNFMASDLPIEVHGLIKLSSWHS